MTTEEVPRLVRQAMAIAEKTMGEYGHAPPPFVMSELANPPGFALRTIYAPNADRQDLVWEEEILRVFFMTAITLCRSYGYARWGDRTIDVPHALICATGLMRTLGEEETLEDMVAQGRAAVLNDPTSRWALNLSYAEPDQPIRLWTRFLNQDDAGNWSSWAGEWSGVGSSLSLHWTDDLLTDAVTNEFTSLPLIATALQAAKALEWSAPRSDRFWTEVTE